jgi:cbb3-type cytochrome oxidase subunit 3
MLETLRIAVTLAAFAAFLAIVWWAYAPSRKVEWERRGRLDEIEIGEFRDGARTRATSE